MVRQMKDLRDGSHLLLELIDSNREPQGYLPGSSVLDVPNCHCHTFEVIVTTLLKREATRFRYLIKLFVPNHFLRL